MYISELLSTAPRAMAGDAAGRRLAGRSEAAVRAAQPTATANLPGNSSTSGIKILKIPICDILNYWCQTPQSLLLMVFLATV